MGVTTAPGGKSSGTDYTTLTETSTLPFGAGGRPAVSVYRETALVPPKVTVKY